MIEEIRIFLALFEGEPQKPERSLRALANALDGLSCAYHRAEPVFAESSVEPPSDLGKRDGESRISRYFPDFGFYPIADPLGDVDQKPMVADAIGDLDEIRQELLEVVWRWENIGEVDAVCSYCWGYEHHWGRFHLPGLRHYITAKMLD